MVSIFPVAAQQLESLRPDGDALRLLTYEYSDFGVRIVYPETWHLEKFAYDERHFTTLHPGHLPGLPLQFLRPTELDVRPQNSEITVLGLYPSWNEAEVPTDTKLLIKVKKVGFGETLESDVRAYIADLVTGTDSVATDPPPVTHEIIRETRTKVSGNDAAEVSSIKRWGWNSEIGDYEHAQRIMRVMTLEDDRIYILQYDSPLEEYDKYFPLANMVVSNFEITSTGIFKTLGVAVAGIAVSGVSGYIVVKAKRRRDSLTSRFATNMRRLLPAALGIEILCISAAEIGGNVGLFLFGYNAIGIVLSYALVYALAGFTTLAAIVGRFSLPTADGSKRDGVTWRFDKTTSCDCCSALDHEDRLSILSSLKFTLTSFGRGVRMLGRLRRIPNRTRLLKTCAVLLLTAESGCILTAATVDFVLYQYSLFISIPISFAAGTVAVAAPHAFRLAKRSLAEPSTAPIAGDESKQM